MAEMVTWRRCKEPVGEEVIQQLQEILGVELPRDYVECAKQYNGGRPSPNRYDINGGGEIFDWLLDVKFDVQGNLLETYEDIGDRLVEGIIPFASDPGGNFICFDYRKGKDVPPTVVFWDHEVAHRDPEEGLTPICNSFTELLGMLRERREE